MSGLKTRIKRRIPERYKESLLERYDISNISLLPFRFGKLFIERPSLLCLDFAIANGSCDGCFLWDDELGCLDLTCIALRFGIIVDDSDVAETFERVIINSIEGVKAIVCYRHFCLIISNGLKVKNNRPRQSFQSYIRKGINLLLNCYCLLFWE